MERVGDFMVGGRVICCIIYTDNLVLLANGKETLHGMLVATEKNYGMELNIDNSK